MKTKKQLAATASEIGGEMPTPKPTKKTNLIPKKTPTYLLLPKP